MATQVFGLLGPKCLYQSRKRWNQLFLDRGIDAFFDFYPTRTSQDLELRFSEMFLHERRGYLLTESLQISAVKLLDIPDASVIRSGKVDVVVNDGGVLTGYFIGESAAHTAETLRLWFPLL